MTQTTDSSEVSVKKVFTLTKEYFLNSDEKLIAWLLLIGIVVCIIALVALMTAIAWWSAAFWAILLAKSLTPFLISIGQLGLIVGALVGVTVLKNYLIGQLTICWRNWLSLKIVDELKKKYLDLSRFPEVVDNIAQRVQEDVKTFVELITNLGTNLIKSVLSLGAFTGTLWVVGGALTFTLLGLNIVIPGFLVWAALIVAIIATVATYFIAKSLPKKTQEAIQAEADLRQDLTQLTDNAENIAEEHAVGYYKSSLDKSIQRVKMTAEKKLSAETKLTAFQNFYFNAAQFLPSIFAAPLYFTGLLGIGQLMQIGVSFTEVSMALSMIVDAYQDIAKCKASVGRIIGLQAAFEKDGLPDANDKSISIKERNNNKDWIRIKNLGIQPPQKSSSGYLMRGLNLKLVPGEHVLVKGDSGIGKSTLFKALAGTWQYGDGKISLPSPQKTRLYFLPQKPTMPVNTLRAVLAYPEAAENYADEQYVAALQAVGGDKFTDKLSDKRDWSKLSGGEQQRISFARALLKKPDWLFLDEATSALDEESEDLVYRAVQEKLIGTTIVSIGHRSTVAKYHSRIVFFKIKDKELRTVELEDTKAVDDDLHYALM